MLRVDLDAYAAAQALNPLPPVITSDPIPSGSSPISQLLRVLVLAGNSGDDTDNAPHKPGKRNAMQRSLRLW